MIDIIIKILDKYVYGRLAYPDIANAILKKLIIELDSCMNDISDAVDKGEYHSQSSDETAEVILNIIKQKVGE